MTIGNHLEQFAGFPVEDYDPDIGIAWPLDVEPVLSEKDKLLPRLKDMPKAEF